MREQANPAVMASVVLCSVISVAQDRVGCTTEHSVTIGGMEVVQIAFLANPNNIAILAVPVGESDGATRSSVYVLNLADKSSPRQLLPSGRIDELRVVGEELIGIGGVASGATRPPTCGHLFVWSARTLEVRYQLELFMSGVDSVAGSSRGGWLVVGTMGRELHELQLGASSDGIQPRSNWRLLSLVGGKILATNLHGSGERIWQVDADETGQWLLTSGASSKLWHVSEDRVDSREVLDIDAALGEARVVQCGFVRGGAQVMWALVSERARNDVGEQRIRSRTPRQLRVILLDTLKCTPIADVDIGVLSGDATLCLVVGERIVLAYSRDTDSVQARSIVRCVDMSRRQVKEIAVGAGPIAVSRDGRRIGVYMPSEQRVGVWLLKQ